MNSAARFLTSMAQAVSTMHLYEEEHPARERALDTAYERLVDLQNVEPKPRFTFLGGEILHEDRPLWDLKGWDWATQLADAGLQMLEFTGPVSREELEGFLDDVLALLTDRPVSSAEARPTRETNIRYGRADIRRDGEEGEDLEDLAMATLDYSLQEEVEAVRWIHEELKEGRDLHLLEAEAIVRSLSVAMHGDQEFVIPLLQLKEFDQYTTTHSLNVSVLSMALAEHIGLSPKEVKTFGISGLLHDLGKTRIPEEILNKPGKLTDEEREVMNSHTVEGAKLIIETDEHLDLAAVVAYEHHIRLDGGGYPRFAFPRHCHQCSNLVHVCDVYDALRTHRPYRSAWEQDRVLDYIREGAGTEFDPHLARAFCDMMERWGPRLAQLEDETEPLRLGKGSGPDDVGAVGDESGQALPVEHEAQPGGADES